MLRFLQVGWEAPGFPSTCYLSYNLKNILLREKCHMGKIVTVWFQFILIHMKVITCRAESCTKFCIYYATVLEIKTPNY